MIPSKNKINILYVHSNNTDIGGADYCLFKMVAKLDRNFFCPYVCLSKETKIINLYRIFGIRTFIIDMERIKKDKNPLFLIKLIVKFIPTVKLIRKIIIEKKINLIHSNDLLDIYGSVAGKISHIPTVQHCRMIVSGSPVIKWFLTQIVYQLNDRVIVISKAVANKMFSFSKNLLPNKLTLLHDWFDFKVIGHGEKTVNIRSEMGIGDNSSVVGVIGRLDPWKGQHIFLKAAAIVNKTIPNIRFLIVGGIVEGRGRENYRTELEKLANDLGIDKKVIFTGHREDIFNIMTALDVFVLSSITPEPLGQVVMEACACGKPVVASDAGGPPEIITHGKTGLLYPIGDFNKLADAIIYLLLNPDRAKKMGATGKEYVELKFDSNRIYSELETLYFNLTS